MQLPGAASKITEGPVLHTGPDLGLQVTSQAKTPDFGAITAGPHIAPAPPSITAGIDEQPGTSFSGALADVRQGL